VEFVNSHLRVSAKLSLLLGLRFSFSSYLPHAPLDIFSIAILGSFQFIVVRLIDKH